MPHPDEAIEGEELLVSGQDIRPSGAPIIRTTLAGDECIVHPINVKKRGRGTIAKEHDPKIALFCEASKLNYDDAIAGRSLWGFAANPIGVNVGGEGRTSTHTGQNCCLQQKCYLCIVETYSRESVLIHPKNRLYA